MYRVLPAVSEQKSERARLVLDSRLFIRGRDRGLSIRSAKLSHAQGGKKGLQV